MQSREKMGVAQLTERERRNLEVVIRFGLRKLFSDGHYVARPDVSDDTRALEFSWTDNNNEIYRLCHKYGESFIPALEKVLIECANHQFPDINLTEDTDFPFMYDHPESGEWGFELWFMSQSFGETPVPASRTRLHPESCWLVLSNRIEDVDNHDEESVVTLVLFNPGFTPYA